MTRQTTAVLFAAGILSAAAVGAQDPYAKPDDSWISISGTVAAPTKVSFMLDYGDGVITVEMNEWSTYADVHESLDGDKVTVYGKIDGDLFEAASIEASSVYVENLNTYYYASSVDDKDTTFTPYYSPPPVPLAISDSNIRGTVTRVNADDRSFTLDTGLQTITVQTKALSYDPLDEFGYQQMEVGDRVSVSGSINNEFFDRRVFEAQSLVTLSDASLQD